MLSKARFKHGYLFSIQEPLRELMKVDVPAKVGIRIARLIKVLNKEIELIVEVRNGLITKYGEKDDKGRPTINPVSPNWATFAAEHDAMMLEEVDVEFEKVVLPDEVHLSVSVLVALEPFLAVSDIPAAAPNGAVTDIRQLVAIGH